MTRGTLKRVGLNALAVLLGVALLEGLLQVGALVLRPSARDLERRLQGDRVRILCLGDSNTYGLYLDVAESWPMQLESLWNGGGGEPRIEVLNAGFPGTNSSQIRRRLDRYVETFRPDVVIVMVGANDFWTDADLEPRSEAEEVGALRRVLGSLRLPRLWFAARRALESPRVEAARNPQNSMERGRGTLRYGDVEFAVGFDRKLTPDAGHRLSENLEALSARTEELGVDLVLMTYPARRSYYHEANRRIREVARRRREPFVDLEAVFREHCASAACPELLFPDNHPRAEGYRILAESVAARLTELVDATVPRGRVHSR